jgi:hypothetical protein
MHSIIHRLSAVSRCAGWGWLGRIFPPHHRPQRLGPPARLLLTHRSQVPPAGGSVWHACRRWGTHIRCPAAPAAAAGPAALGAGGGRSEQPAPTSQGGSNGDAPGHQLPGRVPDAGMPAAGGAGGLAQAAAPAVGGLQPRHCRGSRHGRPLPALHHGTHPTPTPRLHCAAHDSTAPRPGRHASRGPAGTGAQPAPHSLSTGPRRPWTSAWRMRAMRTSNPVWRCCCGAAWAGDCRCVPCSTPPSAPQQRRGDRILPRPWCYRR